MPQSNHPVMQHTGPSNRVRFLQQMARMTAIRMGSLTYKNESTQEAMMTLARSINKLDTAARRRNYLAVCKRPTLNDYLDFCRADQAHRRQVKGRAS